MNLSQGTRYLHRTPRSRCTCVVSRVSIGQGAQGQRSETAFVERLNDGNKARTLPMCPQRRRIPGKAFCVVIASCIVSSSVGARRIQRETGLQKTWD